MVEREMKTDISAVAEALPRMSETQRAEMIGWLNGYVAGAESGRLNHREGG